MKSASAILSVGLAALAAAAPTPSSPTSVWTSNGQQVVSYTAKFDDDPNDGAVPGLPVAGVSSLGPYDSLYYNNSM